MFVYELPALIYIFSYTFSLTPRHIIIISKDKYPKTNFVIKIKKIEERHNSQLTRACVTQKEELNNNKKRTLNSVLITLFTFLFFYLLRAYHLNNLEANRIHGIITNQIP